MKPESEAAGLTENLRRRIRDGGLKFAVLTLGCKLNQYDSGEVIGGLKAAGGVPVGYREADLVVLNTCTVTHRADRDGRKTLRRVRRENPGTAVVVMGCFARREARFLREMPEVDVVLADAGEVRSFLEAILPEGGDLSGNSALPDFGDRTRAFLKIQEGCNLRCSYCIIPSVRGSSRSVPKEKVLREFRGLLVGGYREIVLTGINTGDYGLDLNRRYRLADLLEDLFSVSGEYRVRLNSLEPKTVTPRIVELFRTEPRLARHLQVPLQSGSDAVLRAMRRNYRSETYRRIMETLAERVPGIGLGADVLTGFPTESEEDHEKTLDLIRSLPLAFLHAFSFSAREGTPAAELAPLSPAVIARRSEEIRSLGKEKNEAFIDSQKGAELQGLTMAAARGGRVAALTDNFLHVSLPGESVTPNRFVSLRILRRGEGRIEGEIVGE